MKLIPTQPVFRTLGLCAGLITPSAGASNADFQDYFFNVCSGATATLSTRCAETDSGLGNLSGDSESSLNPTQSLSGANGNLSATRARTLQARERGEQLRTEPALADNSRVALGPLSLMAGGRHFSREDNREVADDAERGYAVDGWGVQLGIDQRLSDSLIVGIWAHRESSELDFEPELAGRNFAPRGNAGAVDSTGTGATLFLSTQLGQSFYVDASAGYVSNDYNLERRAVFQESSRVVATTAVITEADTDGRELWGAITAGYAGSSGAFSWAPYLGLTFADVDIDGYSETDLSNSGLALDVENFSTRSITAIAGTRINWHLSLQSMVLIPQLRVEYVRELDRDADNANVALQQDSTGLNLQLAGDQRRGDLFDVGLGVSAQFRDGISGFIEGQRSFADGSLKSFAISLGLRVEL